MAKSRTKGKKREVPIKAPLPSGEAGPDFRQVKPEPKPAKKKSLLKLPHNRMAEAEYLGGARLQVAMDHGFVPTDLDSTRVFCEHPGGDTLFVYRYGNWIHTSSSGKATDGRGWETLRDFLDGAH